MCARTGALAFSTRSSDHLIHSLSRHVPADDTLCRCNHMELLFLWVLSGTSNFIWFNLLEGLPKPVYDLSFLLVASNPSR